MPVARSTGVFIGTSEGVGVTIANNATTTSSEIDILGNNTSEGWIMQYLDFTSTVTAGTLDITQYSGRVTGQDYSNQAPLIASWAPINGTQLIMLGMFKATRFMVTATKNNATGASATQVTQGYELYQES
jgi:hypothetical protein